MDTAQTTRDRLVGFRVTQREHDLLRSYAEADQRSLTGMLRKLLAETVVGFGATKRERRAERKETNR
jgi:hypothetical protein